VEGGKVGLNLGVKVGYGGRNLERTVADSLIL
jgi:hypothetical protein